MRERVVWRSPMLLSPFFGGKELEDARLLIQRLKSAYALDVIVLTRDYVLRSVAAKDPQSELRRVMLAQVDLTLVAPFLIVGPTTDHMFFGREREIREIVEHISSASYAIIGGRRIGKTSVLLRLHKVLLPAAGFRSLYLDCSATPTYGAFVATPIGGWQPGPPADAPSTLDDLLQSPPDDKPLVLLLDEADKLIADDRADGWRSFNTLRALVSSGRAQIVLSGERTLVEALRDPMSPLFNFAHEMRLGTLGFSAVVELVTRPMRQLEIELVDEMKIVRRIYDITSGHPNIVQRLCRRLIQRLEELGTRRITLDDIDTVTADRAFQEDDFLQTYWEGATLLERIISIVMARDDQCRTMVTVRGALSKLGVRASARETDSALQRLTDLRSILRRTPSGYSFAVSAFPLVISSATRTEDLLTVLGYEYVASKPMPYQVGGALSPYSPVYIKRSADAEALQLVRKMAYVMLIEARQTGKTSLINRLIATLGAQDFVAAYVDLTTLSQESEPEWYKMLAGRISRQLGRYHLHLGDSLPPDSESWLQQLRQWGDALLALDKHLVIALDEIGFVPMEWAEPFFLSLRVVFNYRQSDPGLGQITFLLAGAFNPRDLIRDPKISPFNIAHQVTLHDFSLAQVNKLASLLELPDSQVSEFAERIFHWTSGQPYLTQLMCLYLSSETDFTPSSVDSQVQKLLQEDENHLPRITDFLEQHPDLKPYLQEIAAGEEIPYRPALDRRHSQLSLIGIIKADESGHCVIRNRIYETVFKDFLMSSSAEQLQTEEQLSANLSEEALVGLSFAYGIDYRTLPGTDKDARIRSLVQLLDERGLLATLSQQIRSLQSGSV